MSRPADCLQNKWQAELCTHNLIPFDNSKHNGGLVYYDLENPQFWWHNPTNPSSLRLSHAAFSVLRKHPEIPRWEIKTLSTIKPKTLLQLERHFSGPYYLQSLTVIHVFKETEASMLFMHGGDLQQYLDNHD
jgi:hypothetical protein